jgi:hypothetical protein
MQKHSEGETSMKTNVESGTGGPEVEEQLSASLGDQQASQSTPAPENGESPEGIEQHMAEIITAEVEKRFQSAKDKRWTELERQFGALQEFQQTLETAKAETAQSTQSEDWLAQKAGGLLEDSGLANDPEVQELLQEGGYTADSDGYLHLMEDLTQLALRRANRPRATAGSVIQPSGGAPKPDLRQEYERQMRRLRPGDVSRLMDLKREFRQKGLDVF